MEDAKLAAEAEAAAKEGRGIGAIKEEGAGSAGIAPPTKGVETRSAHTSGSGPRRMMLSVDLIPGQCWSFDQAGAAASSHFSLVLFLQAIICLFARERTATFLVPSPSTP